MTYFDAIILGVVEGLTEFLPVSSTGHLIIVGRILDLPASEFLKTFEIAVQLGAIAAVAVIYWRMFLRAPTVMKRVVAAFLPTAVVGFVVYGGVKTLLGDADVVAWSLFLGGLVIIAAEELLARSARGSLRLPAWLGSRRPAPVVDLAKMSFAQAVGIGLCQTLAMVPGVSRSAATVLGGLMLGLDRRAIVEFSFLLAVPTMLAATGYDLLKSAPDFASGDFGLLAVGMAVAFVTAWFVVKWLLSYIQRHDFRVFGYYRLFAAVAYWLFVR